MISRGQRQEKRVKNNVSQRRTKRTAQIQNRSKKSTRKFSDVGKV